MKKVFEKKNFFLLIALFVLALFAYITYKTPLAGDDWGYALNGAKGSPIAMALTFYKTWSGRFFSELWGMLIPAHKWAWNIINPLLFALIFISVYKLGYVRNKPIVCSLFILAFMLSVDDNLRMETYSWIMGTTYVIPLLLSLVYFVIIDKLMDRNYFGTRLKISLYLSNILAWAKLSIIKKIATAYPNFLQMTFISNNYAILLFSIVLIGLMIYSKRKVHIIYRVVSIFIS